MADREADEEIAIEIKSGPLELHKRDQRHLSSSVVSLALQDDQWAFAPLVSPTSGNLHVRPGSFRYLKGADLDGVVYDFAIVTRRQKAATSSSGSTSPEKDGPEGRVLQRLVDNGLDVDVIEGDFSSMVSTGSGPKSKYFVLLIRGGSDEALAAYGRRLKYQTWLRSGNTREVDALVKSSPIVTPADRIQVIDHIIREAARITANDPDIHSVFPVHDTKTNKYLLKTFIQTGKLEHLSASFLNKMRAHFGEKVAYYFAFMDFYNKALGPIAVLGVLLTCFRGLMGTPMYMRILVVWAVLISVVWSYWFLKAWSRRNYELNYLWENNPDSRAIVYRNPNFRGEKFINPVTGLPDQSYPSWKRYPTYFLVVLFMILQISIMMLIIACWITIFEVLKVRYPDAGIFSAQWFYILGGGILYGLFVDIVQWNLIVTNTARAFTEWENWKTKEEFEKSMVRKLFLMDFLNYYTWFFLLAFVYVIPGAGDTITNFLNTILWSDPANCCFGPYLDRSGTECRACPPSWHAVEFVETRCVPCKGWVTFDINHLDLEKLFLTPIIVTQGLNLLIAVLVPWIQRRHHESRLKSVDRKAMKMVKAVGQRKMIAEMAYRDDRAHLANMSKARYFENDETQMEKLNAKARDILFESEQDNYDPYDDYHHVTVQFGFVVMFSMLWPLMPAACMIVNALKMRGDGFRLCRTLKRPFPRKAAGIGEWYTVLHMFACVGVIVNISLVFVSTGAMEFYSPSCTKQITEAIGGDFTRYLFGPDIACFSITTRMILILVCEHAAFLGIYMFWRFCNSIPPRVKLEMIKHEYAFKSKLYKQVVERAASHMYETAVQQVKRKSPPKDSPVKRHNSQPHPIGHASKYAATIVSGGSGSVPTGSSRRKSRGTGTGTKEEREPLLNSKSLAQAWDAAKSSSSSSVAGG